MAIDDNEDYTLTGAQVKDLASRIKAGGTAYTAGNGINIDANNEISIDDTVVAEVSDIPTKTSDLTNDGSDSTSTYVEADELATVATTGSYSDLTGTPTIPTVNNATLTIQKNGTAVNTFTANASSDVTANITVPTKTSQLTNDSSFLTATTTSQSGASATYFSDGTMIARKTVDLTENISTAWGNMYRGTNSSAIPVAPGNGTDFYARPIVTVTGYARGSSSFFLGTWSAGAIAQTNNKWGIVANALGFFRPNSATSVPITLDIHAIGRWKA